MNHFRILSLNCQKAHNPHIQNFLKQTLRSNLYDFLLLQEANAKILAMFEDMQAYKLLSCINPDIQKQSHVCIIYREQFVLEHSEFLSFSKLERRFALRAELGFLQGTFNCGGSKIIMGSLHLHPGFPFRLRMKEVAMVKNKINTYNKHSLPVIFGGDLNLGFPGEGAYAGKKLAPEFSEATHTIGPTLNSRYTEKGTNLVSKIGNTLAVLGISVKFKTDRIFVDRITAKKYSATSKIVPDRVSDHSPVELELAIK